MVFRRRPAWGCHVQQGPEGTMNFHRMSGSDGARIPHDGQILMPGADSDHSSRPGPAPPGRVPLFRPDHPEALRPVTLDQRTGREIFAPPPTVAAINPARVWESITEITPDPDRLLETDCSSRRNSTLAPPISTICAPACCRPWPSTAGRGSP